MELTLTILKPFSVEKIMVDWVSLACVGGSMVVGPGHRPFVNMLAPEGEILYRSGGNDSLIEVSEAGGLVYVSDASITLFLH